MVDPLMGIVRRLRLFASFGDQQPVHQTRLHYLVTRDFEVGVRVGCGLSKDSANFFSNVGDGVQF